MDHLLEVRQLTKSVRSNARGKGPTRSIRILHGIDLDLDAGEILGLVGESGSGKTTLARCIMRLTEPEGGRIGFDGLDWLELDPGTLRRKRPAMQMIFQDPHAALDPRRRIGASLREPFEIHRIGSRKEQEERVVELLRRVELDPALARAFPHQLSTGQRQRVVIARALALQPKLILADEPVSALDVRTQAQILDLMAHLQEHTRMAWLCISHSLPVIRRMAQRIMVLYLGRVVEQGTTEQICYEPRHPYTQTLLSAVPSLTPTASPTVRVPIIGGPASIAQIPPGCPFHPRCPVAIERCRQELPVLRRLADPREIACHLVTPSS